MNRSTLGVVVTVVALFAGITMMKRDEKGTGPSLGVSESSTPERERVLRFWDLYREATAHRTAGRIREAAATYAEVLALDGRHEDALYYSGNMLFELGEFSEAEHAWRRLIAVNPNSARAHSRLGDLYLCYDRPQWFDITAAEAQYQRAAEINPAETGSLLRLGESALVRSDIATAQARIGEVLSSNATSVEARFLDGYIAWSTGQNLQATTRAARLVELIRDRLGDVTGLSEGETKSGAAMLATQGRCRAVRDLPQLLTGSDSVTQVQITSLYWRTDSILAAARLKIH